MLAMAVQTHRTGPTAPDSPRLHPRSNDWAGLNRRVAGPPIPHLQTHRTKHDDQAPRFEAKRPSNRPTRLIDTLRHNNS